MIPVINHDGSPQCPLGFNMSQNRMAVPVWSYAMEVYPPAQIVELGSGNGGFTTVLAVHAWRIGAKIFSFERAVAPNRDWQSLSAFLGIQFFKGDLFAEWKTIKELIQRPGVTYLLCDDGDKVKEFNMFAPFIKHGDIVAVHDYCCVDSTGYAWWPWSEITKPEIAQTVTDNKLQPWMQEHFDMTGWLAYKGV
jgi:hypothetical protein